MGNNGSSEFHGARLHDVVGLNDEAEEEEEEMDVVGTAQYEHVQRTHHHHQPPHLLSGDAATKGRKKSVNSISIRGEVPFNVLNGGSFKSEFDRWRGNNLSSSVWADHRVLTNVLQFILDPRSLECWNRSCPERASLSLVSTHFYNSLTSLRRHLVVHVDYNSKRRHIKSKKKKLIKSLKKKIRKSSAINGLRLSSAECTKFDKLFGQLEQVLDNNGHWTFFSRLTFLELSNPAATLSSTHLAQLLDTCLYLEHLTLRHCNHHSLQAFNFPSHQRLTKMHIEACLISDYALSSLSSDNPMDPNSNFNRNKFPRLEELTVENCYSLHTPTIAMHQLRRLTLNNCRNLKEPLISCQNLEELTIDTTGTRSGNISEGQLIEIVGRFSPKLLSLTIKGADTDFVSPVIVSSHLKFMALFYISKYCPNVERIILRQCTGLVTPPIRFCPRLRLVDLACCHGVDMQQQPFAMHVDAESISSSSSTSNSSSPQQQGRCDIRIMLCTYNCKKFYPQRGFEFAIIHDCGVHSASSASTMPKSTAIGIRNNSNYGGHKLHFV